MSLTFITPTMPAPGPVPTPAPGASAAAAESDADLWLIAARQGDRAAFARIVRLHQARVFGVALRLCRQREDAQEIAQDAFVQLHRALAQIESAAHLKHWLLGTVTHRAIDRLRQSARRPRLVALEGSLEAAAPEQSADDPLARRQLRTAVAQLAPDAQAVIVLRFQQDLDPMEIATVLGMPHNTVKSHLRRALEQLRGLDWSRA